MLSATNDSASGVPDAIRMVTVDDDVENAFRRIVDVALREIPGADQGGITELQRGSLRTRAASHANVELVDTAQYESGEGPCLSAALAQQPVVVSNEVGTDPRWHLFGPAAAALGINSVLSLKLFDVTGAVGALNLYSAKPQAFTPDAEEIGSVLAAHAGVVMMASRKQANLAVALESRDAIGQAKGILMERYKFDDRQAFEALVAVSQHTHRKLREVAEELRTTGELPGLA
jgi:GAF domain-containing protein